MINGTSAEAVTGNIPFPCCSNKVKVLYGNPTGLVSDTCPRCGKKAMFDLDKKTSWIIEAVNNQKIKRRK